MAERVLLDQLGDPAVVLVGDESGRDLEVGKAGRHRLHSRALKPAPDAIDIDRRPPASALLGREPGFAPKRAHAGLGQQLIVRCFGRSELGTVLVG